jgi:3-mercaptopyruvate sulfurtransferase SseA
MNSTVDGYANQAALVSTEWVAAHGGDPGVRLVEVDVDTGAYDQGHLRGAVGWNWQTDLSDPVRRDLPTKAQRAGHIPGAVNVPWAQAANEDGTFKSAAELAALYGGQGVSGAQQVVASCRIGERSSHTWFVLKELLGYPDVRNYDGSWTEWGSVMGAPIENPAAGKGGA